MKKNIDIPQEISIRYTKGECSLKKNCTKKHQDSKNSKKNRKKFRYFCGKIYRKSLKKRVHQLEKGFSRDAESRKPIKKAGLFDENQNSAEVSKKIAKLMQRLQKEII